jgi:hypothetical protein
VLRSMLLPGDRRPRKGRHRLLRSAVAIPIAVVALLVTASPAFAWTDWGYLALQAPCCGGAALQGDRASLTAPGLGSASTETAVNSSVRAGGDITCSPSDYFCTTQLIQIGFMVDNGLGQPGSCGSSLGSLIVYAESYNKNTGESCYGLGSLPWSTTAKYSDARQTSGVWQVFYNGGLPQGKTITNTSMGNASEITSGAEVGCKGTDLNRFPTQASCNVMDRGWSTTYGSPGDTPWQRYNSSQGWVTIQSNNKLCNGGDTCSGGNWGFSTGSFPSTWQVYR